MSQSRPALRLPRPALFRPLSDPALALLWGGLALSAVGDQVFIVVQAWVAAEAFGPAAGYLTAAQAAVVLATALLAGGWADAIAHRRLMIGADLVRAAALVGLVIVWLSSGDPPAWALVVAIAVLAAGQALFRPALQAMIPALVRRPGELPAANALLDSTERIARLLGPGLVGLLAVFLPLVQFVTLDVLTFLASAAALTAIGRLRATPPPARRWREPVLESAIRGFRAMRAHPLLQFALGTTGIVMGAWYSVLFLGLPLLLSADGDRATGLAEYGMVIGCYGTTNLISLAVVGSRPLPRRPTWLWAGGLLIIGGGLAAIGPAALYLPHGWRLLAICAAAGFAAIGGPMEDIVVAVLRQTHLPLADQAPAMRAWLVANNVGLLLALAAAPTVFGAIGVAPAIALCGLSLMAVGLAGALRCGRVPA